MRSVPDITLERDGHVAVVTLRAPERRNALTAPMVHEFMAICDEIDADQAIGAVVLTAEGASWCAGAHRELLARVAQDPTTADNYEALGLAYRSFVRFGDVAAPTIAAVGGHAVGAGVNLMMAADLRIVAESARIITRLPAYRTPSGRGSLHAPGAVGGARGGERPGGVWRRD